jgi:tRNA A37 methylthiotransferase MiaB
MDAIVDEAKALVDMGAREITLLGQNVNAWTMAAAASTTSLPRSTAFPTSPASATRPATRTT